MSVLLTDKLQPRTTGIAITVVGDMDVTGNISVAGTVTYEDVTNVDSLGIITARSGINVSGGQLLVGSNIKLGNAGVVTATSFVGSGANLTGVASTDYIITGTAATFNNKVNINSTLTASEGLAVTAGVGTFDCDRVRIVRNAGPILELTTNANTADSSIHLLEGTAGSTTNGGAVVYSGAGNRLGICCGTTLTTEKISVLRDSVSVGVGTINPARHLHLHDQSSDTVQLHITNSTTGVSGSDGVSFALGSDESLIINQRESNKILLKTADTDRVSITSGGDVELYGTAAGITSAYWDASANIMYFKDKSYIYMGDGGDFRIKHDGTNTDLYNNTGWLNINSAGGTLYLQGNYIAAQPSGGGDVYFTCTEDAAVNIYYDNSKKWETTNQGTVTTGISTATDFSGDYPLSNRRINMNGDFKVCQRATSQASITSNGNYVWDRWSWSQNGATVTLSQSTTVPTGKGFKYSGKMETTSTVGSIAAGNTLTMNFAWEGQDLTRLKYGNAAAESLRMSFYARASETGVFVTTLKHGSRIISKRHTISSADTWVKYYWEIPGDTSTALTNTDNSNGMSLGIYISSGSNTNSGGYMSSWGAYHAAHMASGNTLDLLTNTGTFYITGVQFEVGETFTPYEHISYGEELAKCKRYYQTITAPIGEMNATEDIGIGYATASNEVQMRVSCSVEMRATPSVEVTTGSNYFRIGGGNYGGDKYISNSWAANNLSPIGGNVYVAPDANLSSYICLLYTSPSPRDVEESRMPSSA